MKAKVAFIPNMSAALNPFLAVLILMLAFSQSAAGQEGAVRERNSSDGDPVRISELYPSGSIRSVDGADEALMYAEQQRSWVEAKFADEERACYRKFFVTSCTDAAKEERRRALAQIQQVEVEANAFKRRARVEERDKALADKAPPATPIIKPPTVPKDIKEPETATQSDEAGSAVLPDRTDKPRGTDQKAQTPDRAARHQERLDRLKEREESEAQKRAANVAAYEKKVRDSEARQRAVAAKKAEKERKRAEKNPERAPVPD